MSDRSMSITGSRPMSVRDGNSIIDDAAGRAMGDGESPKSSPPRWKESEEDFKKRLTEWAV